MKEFFEGMAKKVKEIESDPNLILLSYHVPAPVAETTIAEVEEKLGIALDDDWKAFFSTANGFQLRWADKRDKKYNAKYLGEPHEGPFGVERVDMDEGAAKGCVNILCLEDIFLNKPSFLFGYDPDADTELGLFSGELRPWQEFSQNLHAFDIFHFSSNIAAFVDRKKLLLVHGTLRNSHNGSLFCDLKAYLDLILEFKGATKRWEAFECFEETRVPPVLGRFNP